MQETVPLSAKVSSYSFTSDGWLKEIRYVIQVVDSSGENEIQRSVKDFKVLRKILVIRWPGCIIPVIPEEYCKNNPPTQTLSQCLTVYKIVLERIVSVDYFLNSNVMQLFLKGPADFVKLTNAYNIPNYPSIAESFEINFKDKLDYQMDEDTLHILHDRKETFKFQVKNVTMMERTLSAQASLLRELKGANKKMLDWVEDTYVWIDPEHARYQYELEHQDAHTSIEVWLLGQIIYLESVIKAIEKLEELVKVKEITEKTIGSMNFEIQKLAFGKNTLSTILSTKNKEEILFAKRKTVQDLEAQSKALELMIPILSSKLLNDDIPQMEQIGGAEYEKEVKNYAQELCKDLSIFKEKLSRST